MVKRWWMIDKLSDSLESAKIDKEVSRTILQGWDQLPQKPKPAERAAWMKKVIDRMDNLLEEEIRFKIREDCACCISSGTTRMKTMKKLIKENPDLESFVAAVQDSGFLGAVVELKENSIYATYGVGRCVCTGIYAIKEPVSITYCHCCKGHLIKLLEAALEKPLRGEVLTSCISGSDDCRFAIHLE
jgi:predicted hydrocarbon binding protein